MDKFLIFDQILDAVFVVKETTEIVYANQMASDFCGLSQKRLIGKKSFSELFSFSTYTFPFNENSLGYSTPGPYLETEMTSLSDKGKSGRVQMAVSPWMEHGDDEKLWVFVVHDVSLEEALHSKYRSELEQKEGYIKDLELARAELEKYSKNLEEIVAKRTQELRAANRTLQAVIDSLGQGFMTFDQSLHCGSLYTKACEDLLEVRPAGLDIKEVLKIPPTSQDEFKMWTGTLFSEPLPFEDLKTLGPDWFKGREDKSIYLEYFPIREDGGTISDIVVVATDKTSEVEAKKKLEEEKFFVDMILKFVKGRSSFIRFLQSVPPLLDRVTELSQDISAHEEESFRLLHTLEGESGTFSLQGLRLSSRVPQQILQSKDPGWEKSFAESLEALKIAYRDSLQIVETYFGPMSQDKSEVAEIPLDQLDKLADKAERIFRSSDLADEIRQLKYQETIISAFNHFDGLVQSVSEKLGKKIAPIEFTGGDLRADLRPLRGVVSSFVHVFRNIVDHGIEMPDEREFAGKSAEGKVKVQFSQHETLLKITTSDDGRGIDPVLIREKLKEKFPDETFDSMSDEDVVQQILRPGFSSRMEVGEFSGRGVGMDAVREEVAKLGGSVRILSQVGQGTQFLFEIPLVSNESALKRSA